jgi:hypothetical protein
MRDNFNNLKPGDKIYCFKTCTRSKKYEYSKFTYLKGYWYTVSSIDILGEYVDLKAWCGSVRFWTKEHTTKKSLTLTNYFYADIKQYRLAKLKKINAT